LNYKNVFVRRWAGPFHDFPWTWSGYKMQQSRRQSQEVVTHDVKHVRIFLLLLKLAKFYAHVIKRLRNKSKLSNTQAQRKCPRMIATTTGNPTGSPELAIWPPSLFSYNQIYNFKTTIISFHANTLFLIFLSARCTIPSVIERI